MKLSIVTSLYKSESTVREFYERMTAAAAAAGQNYELLFVNDGSPDGSLELTLELQQRDNRVVVIDLSRNFGHHAALMTGLRYADGDTVFMIDSDLEEPPELLIDFTKHMQTAKNVDAVYGVQEARKGSPSEKILGAVWYWLFQKVSSLRYPANTLTARLMTRRFVQAVVSLEERDLDLTGLFVYVGFNQAPLVVRKGDKGYTSYSFFHRAAMAITTLTSFSARPLHYVLLGGVVVTVASTLTLLISAVSGPGNTAQTLTLFMIVINTAPLLAAVGLLGLYVSKILKEVKRRPGAVVREIYGGSGTHGVIQDAA